MKIGIIGSGIVGRVLGKGFLAEGHQVMLGTRDPSKAELQQWQQENKGATLGSFKEAAAFGELLVLATAGSVVTTVIRQAGIELFKGKTVIDATNPISAGGPENGVLRFFTSANQSLMEDIQALLPQAKLVKAFNSVGNALMYKPSFGGTRPTMFICGNDTTAKATVTGILESFGWEVEDMGMATAAGAIESLCILWCIPGFIHNRWTHAFKLLK